MLKLSFKFSKTGMAAAMVFLLAFAAVFAWIFFVASKNPADSGESGILLLPFAMPWISIVPQDWIGPFTGVGMVLFNALILYFVFGGVRFTRLSGKSE